MSRPVGTAAGRHRSLQAPAGLLRPGAAATGSCGSGRFCVPAGDRSAVRRRTCSVLAFDSVGELGKLCLLSLYSAPQTQRYSPRRSPCDPTPLPLPCPRLPCLAVGPGEHSPAPSLSVLTPGNRFRNWVWESGTRVFSCNEKWAYYRLF